MELRRVLAIGSGEDKREIKSVELDFDRVTTRDIYDAEQSAVSKGVVVQQFELSKAIQWKIAAKAADIPDYLDTELHPIDFMTLCRAAQHFLMGME